MTGDLDWERSHFGILVWAKDRLLVRSLRRGECMRLWILIKRCQSSFMLCFMYGTEILSQRAILSECEKKGKLRTETVGCTKSGSQC